MKANLAYQSIMHIDGILTIVVLLIPGTTSLTEVALTLNESDLAEFDAGDNGTTCPLQLFQEDLCGCNAEKKPPCPLLTVPTGFYKSPHNQRIVFAYQFYDEVLDDTALSTLIIQAFVSVETRTGCVTFRPAEQVFSEKSMPDDMPVIVVRKATVCAASFGGTRKNDPEAWRIEHTLYVNSDCLQGKTGNVQRLLMLALGFPHEHVRSDRDDYIFINMPNVIPAKRKEFQKNAPDAVYYLQYDYESLLHPGEVFSAVDSTVPTIVPKKGAKIGQREEMSFGDVMKIRRLICEGTATPPLNSSHPAEDRRQPPPVTPGSNTSTALTTTSPFPPAVHIAPTATQKCNNGSILRVTNKQTLIRLDTIGTTKMGNTMVQRNTKWYLQPQSSSVSDYLAGTWSFRDGPTVMPTKIETEVGGASTRRLRTEYPPQSADGVYVEYTRWDSLVAQCVPPSEFSGWFNKTSRKANWKA
ncbi:uncharacterized protein LOC129596289 isoform X2 [Paramacrobiotus metropolitanus]|uniref:uncharacterized protein LOC129596289 isoform X2 n=1 Tax=Paramacrobiotus metropolitanus TaxID=2943436 RepID=UPI0024460A43|nr:uncharacterized protein LOC129596289 isoform X2 [Paramacrobiotus metropolitanus]